jgi:hypothetical protein
MHAEKNLDREMCNYGSSEDIERAVERCFKSRIIKKKTSEKLAGILREDGGVANAATAQRIKSVLLELRWLVEQSREREKREVEIVSEKDKELSPVDMDVCHRWERNRLCDQIRSYGRRPVLDLERTIPSDLHISYSLNQLTATLERANYIGLKSADCENYKDTVTNEQYYTEEM